MNNKTTIHLSPALAKLREISKENPSQGFGGMLTTIVERYNEIVRRKKLNLSEAEWNLIRDTMNASCYWDRPDSILVLPIAVRDSIELDKADEKWDVDGTALLEKLGSADYSDLCAIVDRVETWWRDQKYTDYEKSNRIKP